MAFGLGRTVLASDAWIEPGQTGRLRYTFASDQRVSDVTVRTHARLEEGDRGSLIFKRRRLLLRR